MNTPRPGDSATCAGCVETLVGKGLRAEQFYTLIKRISLEHDGAASGAVMALIAHELRGCLDNKDLPALDIPKVF
jgi:hypothetical protein